MWEALLGHYWHSSLDNWGTETTMTPQELDFVAVLHCRKIPDVISKINNRPMTSLFKTFLILFLMLLIGQVCYSTAPYYLPWFFVLIQATEKTKKSVLSWLLRLDAIFITNHLWHTESKSDHSGTRGIWIRTTLVSVFIYRDMYL